MSVLDYKRRVSSFDVRSSFLGTGSEICMWETYWEVLWGDLAGGEESRNVQMEEWTAVQVQGGSAQWETLEVGWPFRIVMPSWSMGAGRCTPGIDSSLDVGCIQAEVCNLGPDTSLYLVKGSSWSCDPSTVNVPGSRRSKGLGPEGDVSIPSITAFLWKAAFFSMRALPCPSEPDLPCKVEPRKLGFCPRPWRI